MGGGRAASRSSKTCLPRCWKIVVPVTRAQERPVSSNAPIPTVTPMIAYQDAAAALEWLARAFGFRERTRIAMPDGSIGHAEMEIGDGLIMLAEPGPQYQNPTRHAEVCEPARQWLA